jgi:hypothetical protein
MIADTISDDRSCVKRKRWNGSAEYADGFFFVFIFVMPALSLALLRGVSKGSDGDVRRRSGAFVRSGAQPR